MLRPELSGPASAEPRPTPLRARIHSIFGADARTVTRRDLTALHIRAAAAHAARPWRAWKLRRGVPQDQPTPSLVSYAVIHRALPVGWVDLTRRGGLRHGNTGRRVRTAVEAVRLGNHRRHSGSCAWPLTRERRSPPVCRQLGAAVRAWLARVARCTTAPVPRAGRGDDDHGHNGGLAA